MSSNVENTEAQQADEAGLTVFRYKLKPKQTRPALVSRKPKEPQGLDSTHLNPTSDGLQARPGSG